MAIGDLDEARGDHLARKCLQNWPVYSDPNLPPKPTRSLFQPTDVTDYQSVLKLFEETFKKYKRIDHVVVTAGSAQTEESWFDHTLNLSEIRNVCLTISW